jgi:hypothetical protein
MPRKHVKTRNIPSHGGNRVGVSCVVMLTWVMRGRAHEKRHSESLTLHEGSQPRFDQLPIGLIVFWKFGIRSNGKTSHTKEVLMSRFTNRVTVSQTTFYTKIIVTPSHGKPVEAMFDSRYGVGREFGAPTWFVKGVNALRDINKFPHLSDVIDDLARVVHNVSINNSRGGSRQPWADVELSLMEISRGARNGRDDDNSLANTYRVTPADDVFMNYSHKTSNEGFSRGMGSVEPLTKPACAMCFIEPCDCV